MQVIDFLSLLPIIIAMTALTRMIILQSKELDSLNIIYEASGILILAVRSLHNDFKRSNKLRKVKD